MKLRQPLESQKIPIWDLDIEEITGHNIEVSGREEVNKFLKEGWILLHLYTLTYREEGIWRQKPMAILGKPRSQVVEEELDELIKDEDKWQVKHTNHN